MHEITVLGQRDQHGGDEAEGHAQIRNQAQNPEHESDEKREVEPKESKERDADDRAVNEADKELPPKEVDQVGVDLIEQGDNFFFERG